MDKRRSILLYPFSLIYGLVSALRNFLYNTEILKSQEFSIPVICVGNLSAGGTGKTPQAEYLIDLLRKEFRVALLSRGYKRKSNGFRFADDKSGVNDIGDEPLQIFFKFPEITVAVDRNRARGITTILKEKPDISVILLDDGFQHRRVTPGYSILLSDYNRLMINDALLPYGNLRESIRNINRADIILITKCPQDLSPIQRRIIVKEINKAPYQNLYFTSTVYKDPGPVFEGNETGTGLKIPPQEKDSGIVLVTGIAYPKPLLEHLKKYFTEIVHLPFSDHHKFSLKDLELITCSFSALKRAHSYIITTEKDAVRLREFTNIAENLKASMYYIPVGISFLNDDKNEFDNLIVDYVRKNKRNNRIS
jgi:tetraacyldisaccharide 4'-kinase